jgi:hypothetical protein
MENCKDILFETDNDYEIPCLRIDKQGEKLELPLTPWGANSRLRKDVSTYHFYVDDYRFENLWKDPSKLINSGCKAIVEPNFSIHDQTPMAQALYNIYRKRWMGRYMQELGVLVYADLFVSPKFTDFNKLGIPKGYNAFFTRALSDFPQLLENDLKIAKEISGLEIPNLIVYGGGIKAKEFCQKKSLLHIVDFMNVKNK